MNKKQLYETIMKKVSKEVKKALNEAYEFDKPDIDTETEDEEYFQYAQEIKKDIENGKREGGFYEYGDEINTCIEWAMTEAGRIEIDAWYEWQDRDGDSEGAELDFDEDFLNELYLKLCHEK